MLEKDFAVQPARKDELAECSRMREKARAVEAPCKVELAESSRMREGDSGFAGTTESLGKRNYQYMAHT